MWYCRRCDEFKYPFDDEDLGLDNGDIILYWKNPESRRLKCGLRETTGEMCGGDLYFVSTLQLPLEDA